MGRADKSKAGTAARSQNVFVSIDSAPKGFSHPVEAYRGPAVMVLFVLFSVTALYALDNVPLLGVIFHGGDLVSAPFTGVHQMPLRLFVFSYMLAFALMAKGHLSKRLKLAADMVITFLLFCALMDLGAVIYARVVGTPMPLTVIEILSGLIGYAIYSFKLLERGKMPSRIPVERLRGATLRDIGRLLGVTLVAGAITIVISVGFPGAVGDARSWAIIGGIGPGVFIFLPLVFLLLYILARIDTNRLKSGKHSPAVTVIIPAHNEEYIIARTIRAIDIAAGNYDGSVSVLVMNNNSTDATAQVATETMQGCKAAVGRVMDVPIPGKSHALNAALAATQTEFVIRIDADTQVGAQALCFVMDRLNDPSVGVVGGLPLPPGGGPFDRARFLELVVKHGFYSVSLSAVNSVVGVPGMFAAYRTDLPRQLGGFVQGMNGEDTDMSLRIGELGYRLVVDPRIQFVSEVPATYAHMREQRLRWFRSVYHVSARCRDLIYSGRPGIRGKMMLPFMLMNSAMRAMMVPMIVFGVLTQLLPGLESRPIHWQAFVAVGVGAPAWMALISCLLNGVPRGILYLPEYLIFRMLRSYFTMESNLSISIKESGQHLYSAAARQRPADKQDRDA